MTRLWNLTSTARGNSSNGESISYDLNGIGFHRSGSVCVQGRCKDVCLLDSRRRAYTRRYVALEEENDNFASGSSDFKETPVLSSLDEGVYNVVARIHSFFRYNEFCHVSAQHSDHRLGECGFSYKVLLYISPHTHKDAPLRVLDSVVADMDSNPTV